jgi:hypothetical protein
MAGSTMTWVIDAIGFVLAVATALLTVAILTVVIL